MTKRKAATWQNHHPFTSPVDEDLRFWKANRIKCAKAYDMS